MKSPLEYAWYMMLPIGVLYTSQLVHYGPSLAKLGYQLVNFSKLLLRSSTHFCCICNGTLLVAISTLLHILYKFERIWNLHLPIVYNSAKFI